MRYIPVSVNRNCGYIATPGKTIPCTIVYEAVRLIETGESSGSIQIKSNMVHYSECNTPWSLIELFLANEALKIAKKTGFSYYPVFNEYGIPALYVSSKFDTVRVILDPITFRVVEVKDKTLLAHIGTLIDTTTTQDKCNTVFTIARKLALGHTNFVKVIRISSGLPTESYLLSSAYIDVGLPLIGLQLLEDLIRVYSDRTAIVDTLSVLNKGVRLNSNGVFVKWADVAFIVDNCVSDFVQGCDYIPIQQETGNTSLYVSADFRHLVKAGTLELLPVTSKTAADSIARALVTKPTAEFCNVLWDSVKVG